MCRQLAKRTGAQTFDSRGNPTAGVAFLSQWPLEVVAGPDDPR